MRVVMGLSVLMMLLLAATARADDEKEKKISVSECPKVVQRTLKKEVGDGKLIDVDVRTIRGVAIYESEVWFGDLEYDIVIRGDGTLLMKRLENDGKDDDSGDVEDEDENEKVVVDDDEDEEDEEEIRVSMADLPKPVMRTLKRESRGGEVEEIEKETEHGKVVYEAEVEFEGKGGEKEYEVEIAEDGTLLCKKLEEEEGKDGAKARKGRDRDDEDEDDDD